MGYAMPEPGQNEQFQQGVRLIIPFQMYRRNTFIDESLGETMMIWAEIGAHGYNLISKRASEQGMFCQKRIEPASVISSGANRRADAEAARRPALLQRHGVHSL